MDLQEYIYRKNMTNSQFAKLLGINRSYFSSCINGRLPFSKRLKFRIEYLTEGQVTYKKLLEKEKESGN